MTGCAADCGLSVNTAGHSLTQRRPTGPASQLQRRFFVCKYKTWFCLWKQPLPASCFLLPASWPDDELMELRFCGRTAGRVGSVQRTLSLKATQINIPVELRTFQRFKNQNDRRSDRLSRLQVTRLLFGVCRSDGGHDSLRVRPAALRRSVVGCSPQPVRWDYKIL